MAEGNPRETLLKYDDAVEMPATDEQMTGQKAPPKGFSSTSPSLTL